jgi:molybdenum cofactor cytidylyltransferase
VASLRDFPSPTAEIRTIHNPNYAQGEMLSSLRTGIQALPPAAPAFLLALADQPAVSHDTISRLISSFPAESYHPPLILPIYGGKRGHPLVISTMLNCEIRDLSPGESLKSVVHRHLSHAMLLPVDDPAILEDLDTPDDFARIQKNWPVSMSALQPSVSAGKFSNGEPYA